MLKISDIPADVREVLAFPLDFSIDENFDGPLWFTTTPTTNLIPIAGEGTGGLYAQLANSGHILFTDSEGAGGIIADSLADLMQLVVTHPYWRDLLKFSGGGSISEMRRAVDWAAREYSDCYPEIPETLRLIQASLGITPSSESLDRLHRSVSTSSQILRLYAPDGTEFDSLFNRFTAPV
jgi:hypothetical protein